MDDIKEVKEPNEITYCSTSDRLGISLSIGDKKVKVNFSEGRLTLNRKSDAKTIKAIDELIDAQYIKTPSGEYELDDNGNKLISPGRIPLPVWKEDVFRDMIASQPVRVELNGKFYEVEPDKLKELVQKDLKGKEK